MGIRSLLFRRRKTHASASLETPSTSAAAPKDEQSLKPHTLTTFDQALADLMTRVRQMGDHVGGMVAHCVPVFLDHDIARAQAIIHADLTVDSQKDELLSRTMETIARHQPVASDLRLALAVEHIAIDLERSADHAKNIAKRTLSLANHDAFDPTLRHLLLNLHEAASSMFNDSVAAFVTRNVALASDVCSRDQIPDAIYDDLFHAVIARIRTNPADAAADVQTLFVGKSLERIADHATNISEEVGFFAKGDTKTATRNR
jgi:phosphate transport system protein